MGGNITETQRFFKIMLLGFHEKLNLPVAFCNKMKWENRSSDQAVLETPTGTWKIKASRNPDGLISFEDGWPDFARRHGLTAGDLVMFEHTGDFRFNAFVFDRTACEKEFIVEAVNPNRPKKTARKELEIPYECQNPYFILKMWPSFAKRNARVWIPQSFWRSNYLGDETCLILRDPCKREWTVELQIHRKGPSRCKMAKGWNEFYANNSLKDDDVCVFELEPGSVRSSSLVVIMDVQIFHAPA